MTTHTTDTCLTMGMSHPCPSCYMRGKGYAQQYHTCTMRARACPNNCPCMGTYTTPTYLKDTTMRIHHKPTHRAYLLGMVILTMVTIMAHYVYTHTHITYVLNGWAFIVQYAAIPTMVYLAYMYTTTKAHYMGRKG